MNPRHIWSQKKSKWLAVASALLIVVTIGCCAFLRISRPADIEAYRGMASECHPVWKQFALRRFSAGDSVVELFQRFPPDERKEFGQYGVYSYYQSSDGIPFTSLGVVTRDSRLLSAESASCNWRFTFFRTEDPDLDLQLAALVNEQRAESKRKEREGMERLETKK